MRKFLLSLIFVLSLLTFQSCDIDNSNEYNIFPPYTYGWYWQPGQINGNGQYAIGGYTNGQQTRALTRAAITTDAEHYGGKFSLFGLANGTETDSLVMQNYEGVFSGNTWGYTESVKYFDNFVPSYNFLGIIPQKSYIISDNKVEINAQQFTVNNVVVDETYADDQEILVAQTEVAKENYSTGATLQFKHLNSKIGLYFTSDDEHTEILDYYPGVDGYIIYELLCKPFVGLGPKLTDIDITDEDIEYINSHYTLSAEWKSYYSSNATLQGDLDNSMLNYLTTKYGLSNISKEKWADYINNANMRLLHIDKTGHKSADNDSYRAWFVNIENVTLKEIGTSGSTSVSNIIVLPATSSAGDGSDAVLSTYPDNVTITADLKNNTYDWTTVDTKNTLTFAKPSGTISTTRVAAPMTWFTFPYNDVTNVGYTIKVSYKYKGVNVYDARVWIPASECDWQPGKYYKYIIDIRGKGNGHDTPNNYDADDPVVNKSNEIRLTVSIVDYESGNEYSHVIQ